MKKIAALVETTGDRAAAAVKSGSTVFSVPQQQNKACHKAPAKVITMSVSGGNSKQIFELFTNKLVFSVPVSQRWRIRRAFREKCIFTDYNERVFVFDLIYVVK